MSLIFVENFVSMLTTITSTSRPIFSVKLHKSGRRIGTYDTKHHPFLDPPL